MTWMDTIIEQSESVSGSSSSLNVSMMLKKGLKMRKNIVVVTIVIASISTAFGGFFDSTNVHLPHSGSMSLEFGLSGLFRGSSTSLMPLHPIAQHGHNNLWWRASRS